jgi:hypothetical protein
MQAEENYSKILSLDYQEKCIKTDDFYEMIIIEIHRSTDFDRESCIFQTKNEFKSSICVY